MTEAETLYGDAHVQRYRETGGKVGHAWKKGSKILLLTTNGRSSGEPRTTPLIYEADGDRYVREVSLRCRSAPRLGREAA